MTTRPLLLISVAAFFLTGFIRSEDATTLPSRKVEVVLPFLNQFSSKDDYSRIIRILGKEDFDIGNAYRECFFRLEGSKGIFVKASLDGKRIYSISCGDEVIYGSKAFASLTIDPKLPGSDLKLEDAILKCVMVFVGEIRDLGVQDMSTDHTSSGPEFLGVKVKVTEVVDGTVNDSIAVSIYPNRLFKQEITPMVRTSYIFFLSNSVTVLKMIPAMEGNIAKVKSLIAQLKLTK